MRQGMANFEELREQSPSWNLGDWSQKKQHKFLWHPVAFFQLFQLWSHKSRHTLADSQRGDLAGYRGERLFTLKRKKKISSTTARKPKIRKSCGWLNTLFSGFRRSESCLFLICLPMSKSTTTKGSGRWSYGDGAQEGRIWMVPMC